MSTELGRQAEQIAARYVMKQKGRILYHNWRTRWCEIDLIAERRGELYFFEVKYRSQTAHGSGLDYITAAKLSQMRYAAEYFMATERRTYSGYHLAALELTGKPPMVTTCLWDIS